MWAVAARDECVTETVSERDMGIEKTVTIWAYCDRCEMGQCVPDCPESKAQALPILKALGWKVTRSEMICCKCLKRKHTNKEG